MSEAGNDDADMPIDIKKISALNRYFHYFSEFISVPLGPLLICIHLWLKRDGRIRAGKIRRQEQKAVSPSAQANGEMKTGFHKSLAFREDYFGWHSMHPEGPASGSFSSTT